MTGDPEALLAAHMIAQDELENLQRYLEQGRAHHALTAEGLQSAYVAAVAAWAGAPFDAEAIETATDLMSEYRLRDLDPPDDLVSDDIARITSGIEAGIAEASSMEEIGEALIGTHQAKQVTRQ